MWSIKVHLILLEDTIVVAIIVVFDVIVDVGVDTVLVVFLIVVADHIVLNCGH